MRWTSANYLVHCSTEMTVKNTIFIKRLANNTTNELEETKMLRVDSARPVRVEGRPVGCNRGEKSIVRIEHLPREDLEPLASDAASIHTFFALEADVKFSVLYLISSFIVHRPIRVQEDLITPNIELEGLM